MKLLDEYRDRTLVLKLAETIQRRVTRPWTIMEVCGGQTHSIVRFGIDQLLPPDLRLVHGPGCPVCVTPIAMIDAALEIAQNPDVVFCSFGDMLRVPGSTQDLQRVRALGADVRIVYSPMDAVALAARLPGKEVVFFAVGFETTAPATALAALLARQRKLKNFSLLAAHVLVPPAMRAILDSPQNEVQAFLAAGHVCTIMGIDEYPPLSACYGVPIVVTGFEPVDILQGILLAAAQLEEGRAEVENAYGRVVRPSGNEHARRLVQEVFEAAPREWRGLGEISDSGLTIRRELANFDALRKFKISCPHSEVPQIHLPCGSVLQGRLAPTDCPHFGGGCTPELPLGALMVSSEGACAAYYRYRSLVGAQA